MIKCLSDEIIVFIDAITGSDKFTVAILGLHFLPMQSISTTNVDEDESAFVALLLWLASAANEEQYAQE